MVRADRKVRAAAETPTIRVAAVLATLGGLTAVAPLATDMYVAAFPAMARQFGAPESMVQLSMTAFVVGLAVGQFLVGPISDSIGRRRPLLIGTAAFAIASFLSAVAPSAESLTVLRLVQGLAGAVGIVLGRAVVADLFEGPAVAKHFSTLTSISILGPVIAPAAGGLVLAISTWQTIFIILGVIGALLCLAVAIRVPESLPPERRNPHGVGKSFGTMLGLLRRPRLVGHVLTLSLGMLALFAYILQSAFIFQDQYGLSATQYSMVFTVNALGILVASLAVGRLASRVSLGTLLASGAGLSLVAGAVLGLLSWTGRDSFAATWVLLFVVVLGLGLALPSGTTLVLAEGRDAAGGASALLGGTQFIFAGLAAPALALAPTAGTGAMATVLVAAFLLMLICALVQRRSSGGVDAQEPTA